MRRSALALVAVAMVALLLSGVVGCGSSGSAGSSATSPGSGSGSAAGGSGSVVLSGTVNVFAAASLRGVFTGLGEGFEAAHPGVRVVFNFGPSSGLAAQIGAGAPADVFASASTRNMDQVVAAGLAASPAVFAGNVMAIAVPVANPAGITVLGDLARPGVKVALCQPAVPCGVTAARVLTNAKLTVTAVTEEVDVKAVLTKVTLGEVDAGVVYLTDVRAAGARVRGIAIPAGLNATTRYPVATLTGAPNKATAQAFTDYVLSPGAAGVLTAAGFAKP